MIFVNILFIAHFFSSDFLIMIIAPVCDTICPDKSFGILYYTATLLFRQEINAEAVTNNGQGLAGYSNFMD